MARLCTLVPRARKTAPGRCERVKQHRDRNVTASDERQVKPPCATGPQVVQKAAEHASCSAGSAKRARSHGAQLASRPETGCAGDLQPAVRGAAGLSACSHGAQKCPSSRCDGGAAVRPSVGDQRCCRHAPCSCGRASSCATRRGDAAPEWRVGEWGGVERGVRLESVFWLDHQGVHGGREPELVGQSACASGRACTP